MAHSSTLGSADKLGGVHADFAAGLGRKVRTLVGHLESAKWQEATKLVTQIRTGAATLKLRALQEQSEDLLAALHDLGVVEQASTAGAPQGLDVWRSRVQEWPGLAWLRSQSIAPVAFQAQADPNDVLVWGAEALAEAVRARGVYAAATANLSDPKAEVQWLHVRLALVDSRVEGCEAFFDEAQGRNLPTIVLVEHAQHSAAWRARGAAATLVGAVAPGALRRAVASWLRQAPPAATDFAGVWTVGDLANRAADAFCEALMPSDIQSRSARVDMGDGQEFSAFVARSAAVLQQAIEMRVGTPLGFVAPAEAQAADARAWTSYSTCLVPADASVLRGARVLVAEDDAAMRWRFAGWLRERGCDVVEAGDGQEAWAQLDECPFDLVIADLLMPNLDGFGLREAMLSDAALRSTPLLLLSWKDDWLDEAITRGADPRWMTRKDVHEEAFVARCCAALTPYASLVQTLGTRGLPLHSHIEDLCVYAFGAAVAQNYAEAEMVLRNADSRITLGFSGGAVVYAHAWTTEGHDTGLAAIRSALRMRRGEVLLREGRDSLTVLELQIPWKEIPKRVRKSTLPMPALQRVSPQSQSPRSLWELARVPVQEDYLPRGGRAIPVPGFMLESEIHHTPLDHIQTHVDATLYGMPSLLPSPRSTE